MEYALGKCRVVWAKMPIDTLKDVLKIFRLPKKAEKEQE